MMALEIDIGRQQLILRQHQIILKTYAVSTARNGPGEHYGSEQTPRGRHVIRAKIGAGAAPNTVFIRRRPTGERYHAGLRVTQPERDWILTRILWLCGCERGKNRFGNVDSMKRKIYIHGVPDEVEMGVPGSRGCVRMNNTDIMELFDLAPVGTPVILF